MRDLVVALALSGASGFVAPGPPVALAWRTAPRKGVEDGWGEFPDDGWELEVVHRTSSAHFSVDPAAVAALGVVAVLLLLSLVVTVPEPIRPQAAGDAVPSLSAWTEVATDGAYRWSSRRASIAPVATLPELLEATLFQWRVFSLETNYPTGFGGRDENAAVELVRAVSQFFLAGVANRARYEAKCAEECLVGADDALETLPEDLCCDPQDFVDGFGLSLAARSPDGALDAVASLRVRPLDDAYCAYVTGLAVARAARRQGLASALLDFCARKGAAWGCDGIALHVNKLNAPALRFYANLGFDTIPDCFGYNPTRFLLYARFDHDHDHHSSRAADRRPLPEAVAP